jgi:hypothetical protein
LTDGALSSIFGSKLTDVQRLDNVVRESVAPAALWAEISTNLTAFAAETKFDGGLTISPIAKLGWHESDFAINGVASFSGAIRNIRNGLAHGRDQRTSGVITPTAHNAMRLRPWVSLIAVAAGDVMVYKDVVG